MDDRNAIICIFLQKDAVKINVKAIIENISDETLEKIIQVLDEVGIYSISLLDLDQS